MSLKKEQKNSIEMLCKNHLTLKPKWVKSLDGKINEVLHTCRVQNDVNPLFKEDGSSRRELIVKLNLFQHLTSLACRLLLGKTLKRVQGDILHRGALC